MLSSIWDNNNDYECRLKIIESLTKFVPGILSICSIIVNATDTQHHSLTVVRKITVILFIYSFIINGVVFLGCFNFMEQFNFSNNL